MISRRRFLIRSLGATGVIGLTTGFYTWRLEPHWLEVVTARLPVRGLPDRLVGARLVQLSDLHVGPRVDDGYIRDTFSRVTALSPDIVVFTGDFTTYHPDIFAHAERIYTHLPHGRLGTLGILGNHDYGRNWAHPEIADGLVTILTRAGVHILRNEVTDVAGLQVVGLDDLWARRFRPFRTVSGLRPDEPTLALSHNPDTVDLPGWEKYGGWILSGHTHGGQCKPPFLPPPLLPVRNRRYTAGEFDLSGGRRLYINRGVGHLLRVRFNVRPEITVFELTRS